MPEIFRLSLYISYFYIVRLLSAKGGQKLHILYCRHFCGKSLCKAILGYNIFGMIRKLFTPRRAKVFHQKIGTKLRPEILHYTFFSTLFIYFDVEKFFKDIKILFKSLH